MKCWSADNFNAATVLSGAVVSGTESNAAATTEAGEPLTGVYRSLWWKWTAPSSGRVNVSTTGSASFYKYLAVYLAKTNPAQLSSLAFVDYKGATAPAMNFAVVAGTTYYVEVAADSASGTGSVQVTVSLDSQTDINQLNIQGQGLVSNDFFAQRAPLTGPFASSVAYAYSATTEPAVNEPANGNHTVWWTWTAPGDGRVTISTVGSETNYKYLSVFVGNQLNSLRWVSQTGATAPTVTIPVTQNQTYQIAVGSDSSAGPGGAMVLTLNLNTETDINQMNIKSLAGAANDLFANRVSLVGADVSSIGYGMNATREGVEPAAAFNGTLWWTYAAPSAGPVTISLLGTVSTPYRYLTVWTGGSLGTLTQVKQGAGTVPSVAFNATAGQVYQISVGADGTNQTAGTVVLTLSGPPGPSDGPVTGLEIGQAVRLRWPTTPGASYRLKSSNDLKTWTNMGELLTGDGNVRELYQPVVPGKTFFRIYNP